MEERIARLEEEVLELREQLTQMIDALYVANDHYQTINAEVNSTLKNDMGNMDNSINTNARSIVDLNGVVDDIIVAITPTEE